MPGRPCVRLRPAYRGAVEASRTISLDRPLDLGSTVLSIVATDPSRRTSGDTLRVAGWFDGRPFQLAMRVRDRALEAEAWGPGADAALDGVPRLVGEYDDPSGFAPTHGALRRLWRANPGMRIGATGRPLETLVVAILAQKVTTAETGRSLRGLVRRLGEQAPGPEGLWLLPPAEVLAGLAYHDFHPLGVERRRAEALVRVARSAPAIERAAAVGAEAFDAVLTGVRGVGPWTSALVRDRALGDPDAVPVGDYHLPNGVAWLLAGEERATDDRMLELLEPYRGHRARVLRLVKLSGIKAPRRGPRRGVRDIRGL